MSCKANFKKDENGVCKYSDPYCIESYNSRCEACIPNYYVDAQGKCEKLPPNCLFANFQTGDCLECEEGYEISPSKICTEAAKIENCEVVDPTNRNKCIICTYGYFPSMVGC